MIGRKLMLAAIAAFSMSYTDGALAQHAEHHGSAAPAAHIAAAVADPGRPEADVKRDADRKPAEMLAYADVQPGTKVADFIPGGGYFTRLFSKAVGPKGKVYAITNPPPANAATPHPMQALTADPSYANVQWVSAGIASFGLPEPVDVLWTSQNFHDLYARSRNIDVAQVTKAIYDAVKPGGVFVVLDHAAAPGSPIDPDDKLHRIDPAAVRQQVEAAGFRFEGESTVLRNPADDHTKTVFDPAIRGKTDQFIYKFRKPE